MDVDCVGFSDCPCEKHSQRRMVVTASHPSHTVQSGAYCGVCLTGIALANRATKGV